MASKYYVARISPKTGKKTVTINTLVSPTPADTQAVQFYVNAGYEVRYKSEKRAEKARKRAKETNFGRKKKEAPVTEDATEAEATEE